MAKPKQKELPGMEGRRIEEIESAAEKYVEVRDERMKWTTKESDRKQELLGLMKKNRLKTYNSDGIEIEVIVEKEKLKVTVGDSEGEDDA